MGARLPDVANVSIVGTFFHKHSQMQPLIDIKPVKLTLPNLAKQQFSQSAKNWRNLFQ